MNTPWPSRCYGVTSEHTNRSTQTYQNTQQRSAVLQTVTWLTLLPHHRHWDGGTPSPPSRRTAQKAEQHLHTRWSSLWQTVPGEDSNSTRRVSFSLATHSSDLGHLLPIHAGGAGKRHQLNLVCTRQCPQQVQGQEHGSSEMAEV